MIEQLVEMLEEIVKNDRIFDLNAEAYSKMVKALEKKGFTRKEALEIVKTQGSGFSSKAS